VRVEHRGDPFAGLLAASLEVKDVLDLLQTQVQGLGASDEVQDRDVVGVNRRYPASVRCFWTALCAVAVWGVDEPV